MNNGIFSSLLQQMMNNSSLMQNPIAKNAIEMYQKGDINGVNEMARNLCRERGINMEDVINQIKSNFKL